MEKIHMPKSLIVCTRVGFALRKELHEEALQRRMKVSKVVLERLQRYRETMAENAVLREKAETLQRLLRQAQDETNRLKVRLLKS